MVTWCKLHDGITSSQSRIEEVGELYFPSKGRPKVDISRSAENESSAESRLWVSAETENSPKVNCHFRPKAETETESDGV